MSNTHDLKTWPDYFESILTGAKKFEIRPNDRDYKVDDILRLREYSPGSDEYTGREKTVRVTYAIYGDHPLGFAFGVRTGFVAMGFE
jgi:hypothetical protein